MKMIEQGLIDKRLEEVRATLLACRENGQLPGAILWADYDSVETLRLFRPEDGPDATLEDHRLLNTRIMAALSAEFGIPGKRVLLDADGYFDWLAAESLENTPANRATYTGIKHTDKRAD